MFKVPVTHPSGKISRLSNSEMSRGEVQAGEINFGASFVCLYVGLKQFKAVRLELTKNVNLDKIATK